MFSQRIIMMRQQFFILLASMVVVLSGTIAYFAYHNLTYDRARTRQIRHGGERVRGVALDVRLVVGER